MALLGNERAQAATSFCDSALGVAEGRGLSRTIVPIALEDHWGTVLATGMGQYGSVASRPIVDPVLMGINVGTTAGSIHQTLTAP